MSVSVLYMSMSVDGYIAGPNDTSDNPGGDGFMQLHEWFHFGPDGEVSPELATLRIQRSALSLSLPKPTSCRTTFCLPIAVEIK